MNRVPVLVIAYRRYDYLAQLLAALEDGRPLYVVLDGPRCDDHIREVAMARGMLAGLAQYRPKTQVFFRDDNMGGPIGIPAAIDWALERENQILILEEDCIPSPLAFPYIDKLSIDIAGAPGIAGATLNNFVEARLSRRFKAPFLSIFPHCWGWFTTRQAWWRLRPSPEIIRSWGESDLWSRLTEVIASLFPSDRNAQLYWLSIFSSLVSGDRYHWDYAYTLNMWSSNLKFVAPPRNLASNIGIDFRSQNCKTASQNHLLSVPSESDQIAVKALISDLDLSYSYSRFDRKNQHLVFSSRPSLRGMARKAKARLLFNS